MNQTIQDLKAQFPAASGVEKIALARKIVIERKLANAEPIALVDDPDMPIKGNVREFGKYLLNKYRNQTFTNEDTGNEIGLYKVGLESSLKNRNLLAKRAYAVLPQLLKNAIYTGEYLENTKKEAKPNIAGYETYRALINIDGKTYPIKLLVDLVNDNTRGRGYYYHQVEEVTLGEPVGSPRELLQNEASSPDSSNGERSIAQTEGNANNPVLDDATQSTLTIADLKSQFPTANGMGKIALTRQILQLRKQEDIPAFMPIINVVGSVDNDFSFAVQNAVAALPEALTKAIAKEGYAVVLAKTVTSAIPRLAGKTPRGYPHGATWDNADGLTTTDKKIVISQYVTIFSTNKTVRTSNKRATALVRHEYAHAVDRIYSISDSDDFITAYNQDAGEITGKVRIEQLDELDYALQSGAAGRQEVFADIFASLYGGGTAEMIDLKIAFPHTSHFIKQWLKTV